MRGEKLRLVYTELGDDIKSSTFARLIYHLNKTLLNLMQATHAHWDGVIGPVPIAWSSHDYWFRIDEMHEGHYGLTWFWLQALFELLEWCYVKGQIREFQAKLYYDSKQVAKVKVYFYRAPEGALGMD